MVRKSVDQPVNFWVTIATHTNDYYIAVVNDTKKNLLRIFKITFKIYLVLAMVL